MGLCFSSCADMDDDHHRHHHHHCEPEYNKHICYRAYNYDCGPPPTYQQHIDQYRPPYNPYR